MKTTLTKWGNSLAIRIPKLMAEEIDLVEGRSVELRVAKGSILIKPATARKHTLDELVSEITKRNVHRETFPGEPLGREAW